MPLISREQALNAFNQYDEDGSGRISAVELKQLLKDLFEAFGAEIEEEELSTMTNEALKALDQDGSGEIEFEEFFVFVQEFFEPLMKELDTEEKTSEQTA